MSFNLTETFVLTHCARCGVAFAVTADYNKRRRDDHTNFYCPSGHTNVYNGKTDAERLRDEVDWLKGSRDRARDQAERLRRQHIAAKGQITKLRKRLDPPQDDQTAEQ